MAPSGAGQDFVLFDDGNPAGTSSSSVPSSSSSSSSAAPQTIPTHPSMPPFTSKPSFTQYRAPPGTTSMGPGSAGPESPFSSPAWAVDDDFASGTSMGAGPSSLGSQGSYSSNGSGTLSEATGVPNRKRQRPNDVRAHASSTSLSSLAAAMGGNEQQRAPANRQADRRHASSSLSRHRHSIGGLPPYSIPGLSDSNYSTNPTESLMGNDWSLADTSPQNPPSGSFGPAIGSLSLGSEGDDYLPLFPEAMPSSSQEGMQSFLQGNGVNGVDSNGNGLGQDRPRMVPPSSSTSSMFSDAQPMTSDPTPAQEAMARQQVQQDLEGIDQRALRGPLRDLAQNIDSGKSEPSKSTNEIQMDASLRAAIQDFVNATSGGFGRVPDARAPGAGTGPSGFDTNLLGSSYNLSQAQRSLLFPGARGPAQFNIPQPGSTNPSQPLGAGQQLSPQQQQNSGGSQRPSAGPRRRSNSFDASFLPASRPWFSQSPPKAPVEPQNALGVAAPPYSGPGGAGMGTGTGWIDQPTNNFNAFDLSGGTALGQLQPPRRSLTRDRSFLTCTPQETFLNQQGEEGNKDPWQGTLFPGTTASNEFLSRMLAKATANGSGDNGPGTPTATSVKKPPMSRGDTIRPSAQQMAALNAVNPEVNTWGVSNNSGVSAASQQRGPPALSESASSGLSLFSPASGETTPEDCDDDPDEKPQAARKGPSTDYSALLKGAQQQEQNLQHQHQQQHQILTGGKAPRPQHTIRPPASAPRFMPSSSSSSSSSDSDDEGFNYLRAGAQSSPPSLGSVMAPAAMSQGARPETITGNGPQPLARGRGLQGGYGYMPGSAESGLQVDPGRSQPPASGMKSTAVDTTMVPSNGGRDTGSLSPSIRSTAQIIEPPQHLQLNMQNMQQNQQSQQQQQQRYQASIGFDNMPQQARGQPGRPQKSAYGGQPAPDPNATMSSGLSSRRGSAASGGSATSSSSTSSQWESEGAEDDAGEDAESDYDPAEGQQLRGAAARSRKNKSLAATNNKRRGAAAAAQTPMYGHSIGADGAPATSSSSPPNAASALHLGVGGVSHHGALTICEYVSPLTGSRCGVEFHRPYDLARHRETIHAKEEASLVRQGKLRKEQCRVLYVEVDPAKSQATQEWKCDGRNGCGSVFSRKDALQRHRRLRNH
ncbi:unnamed protein product [Jaminaea pallidilutea]